jgi:hypothetical protein
MNSTLEEVGQLETLKAIKSGDKLSITYIGEGVPRRSAVEKVVTNVLHGAVDQAGHSTRMHLQQMLHGGLIPKGGEKFTATVGSQVISPAMVAEAIEGQFEIVVAQ